MEQKSYPDTSDDDLDYLIKKLTYAKDSTRWLLDHESGSVDCHGLSYWAEEVERLRQEIKKLL